MSLKQLQRQSQKNYRRAVKNYIKALVGLKLAQYNILITKKQIRKKFSKRIRSARLILQNYRCMICGCFLDVYEFDHIDGNRANNSLFNCQALCPTCHARKSKRQKMGFSF